MSISDQAVTNILADIEEGERLKTLSNEELVREHAGLKTEDDDDLYLNEFYSRIWAEWEEANLG